MLPIFRHGREHPGTTVVRAMFPVFYRIALRRGYGITSATPVPVGEELSMPTDSVMVVRCRYCVLDNQFVAMPAYKDGRFVCIWCAHTVRVDDPVYHCT